MLFQKIVMKVRLAGVIIFIILALTNEVSAQVQSRFASITKNYNVAAKSLSHDLNSSRDTLKLKSSGLIHRVYTAGKTRGMVDVIVNRKRFDLSLRELSLGKHIFVVQDLSRKIIFHIFIHNSGNTYREIEVGE